jgi:hypothetical protein
MSKIRIKWLSDEHDCELCGWSYSTGAHVYIDDALVMEFNPVAHCYDDVTYEPETILKNILEHLGHIIETE